MAKGNYRDEQFMKAFGQRVRTVRKGLGMTIEDLAHATDFPPTTVGRIERAEINTTISTARRIAEGLGMELWELMQIMNNETKQGF